MIAFLENVVKDMLRLLAAVAFIEGVIVLNAGDIKGAIVLMIAAVVGDIVTKIQ